MSYEKISRPTNGSLRNNRKLGTRAERKGVDLREVLRNYTLDYLWQKNYAENTYKNYEWAINSFIKANGSIEVGKITQDHILAWRKYMESHDYLVGTVNSFLYRLRSLLRYAAKKQKLLINPDEIVIPRKEKKLPSTLTLDDIKLILSFADDRERAIILILYSSGMRVGELSKLRVNDIQTNAIKIRGKGNKERLAFLDDRARQSIREYIAVRNSDSPLLFASKKGGGLCTDSIKLIVKNLSRRSGVYFSCHMLRHTFATEMIRSGCGAFHLQQILGHEHISTTQMYVHLNTVDIQKAYAQFHKEI